MINHFKDESLKARLLRIRILKTMRAGLPFPHDLGELYRCYFLRKAFGSYRQYRQYLLKNLTEVSASVGRPDRVRFKRHSLRNRLLNVRTGR